MKKKDLDHRKIFSASSLQKNYFKIIILNTNKSMLSLILHYFGHNTDFGKAFFRDFWFFLNNFFVMVQMPKRWSLKLLGIYSTHFSVLKIDKSQIKSCTIRGGEPLKIDFLKFAYCIILFKNHLVVNKMGFPKVSWT